MGEFLQTCKTPFQFFIYSIVISLRSYRPTTFRSNKCQQPPFLPPSSSLILFPLSLVLVRLFYRHKTKYTRENYRKRSEESVYVSGYQSKNNKQQPTGNNRPFLPSNKQRQYAPLLSTPVTWQKAYQHHKEKPNIPNTTHSIPNPVSLFLSLSSAPSL